MHTCLEKPRALKLAEFIIYDLCFIYMFCDRDYAPRQDEDAQGLQRGYLGCNLDELVAVEAQLRQVCEKSNFLRQPVPAAVLVSGILSQHTLASVECCSGDSSSSKIY